MQATLSLPSAVVSDNNLGPSNSAPKPPLCVSSASRHSGTLFSLGRAATLLGFSQTTLRRLCDEGAIEVLRLPSGHRRISKQSLDSFQGLDNGNQEGLTGAIAIYARVSSYSQDSKGQDNKSSLDRQIERLLKEVAAREGIPQCDIVVYKDVASSFGDREGLNRLVDGIIGGSVGKVYCLYLDRLSRVPALTRLVEHLAEKFGVEIIPLDSEDCEDKDVWQKELLGYLTVWCNRQSAQRAKAVCQKNVNPDAIRRMIELRQKGYSLAGIGNQLWKEGYKAVTKSGVESRIGYAKIREVLDENGAETVLTKVVCGESANIPRTIEEFVATRIKKGEGWITSAKIYPAYVDYCRELGMKAQARNCFGKVLVKILPPADREIDHGKCWDGFIVE